MMSRRAFPFPPPGVAFGAATVLALAACAPDDTGAERDTLPADTVAATTPEPARDTAWTTGLVAQQGTGTPATLTGVRVGRHEGYDRIVFEFDSAVPGFSVRYPDAPITQCGSGAPVDPGAPAALVVDLRPAQAHDDAGQVTVAGRSLSPALPTLRTARLTCDFEAIVEWVVGLEWRAPFRVIELASPARLVVDVRHR